MYRFALSSDSGGEWKVSLAAWMPTNPSPPSIASSKDCLPCDDIGGFESVPVVVKSPVVKKSTAACFRKSFESNTLPSLVEVTSKPCFFPSTATAESTMLGLPPLIFTTSCSNPEDFVKTSTDFFSAANRHWGTAKLAPAAAPVRKNCRRLRNSVIRNLSVSGISKLRCAESAQPDGRMHGR